MAEKPTPDTFPYADAERGRPLPLATARGVLDPGSSDRSRGPEPTTDSKRCPECGGSLFNGAGLFACGDCDWYGSLR